MELWGFEVMNYYHDLPWAGATEVCVGEFGFCQAKLDLKSTECNTAQGSFERSFCDESKQVGSALGCATWGAIHRWGGDRNM